MSGRLAAVARCHVGMASKRSHKRKEPMAAAQPSAVAASWRKRSGAFLLAAATALIAAAPLIPSEAALTEGSHVMVVMGWLLLTVAWLTRSVLTPRGWRSPAPTDLAVLLFLAAHSLSALVMLHWGHGRPAFNALWQWVSFGLLYAALRHLARAREECRAICSVLVAMAVGLAALGFYQYGYDMPRERAEYAADPASKLAALEIGAGSPAQRHLEDRLASTEPFGPFALANSLAGFLVPWLVLVAGVAAFEWPRATARLRIGLIAAAMAIAVCLVLTKSRSAYAAVAAGGALLFVSRAVVLRRIRWRWAICAAAILVVSGAALLRWGGLDRQVLTETPKSLLYRLQYWRATAAMVADHPWLGCGPGNFKAYYARYKLPEASEVVSDPHNFLLEVAATAGLPALVLFAAIAVLGAVDVRRAKHADRRTLTSDAGNHADQNGAGRPAVVPVYAGLAVGTVLAIPAGWAGGETLDLAIVWLTLPVMGLIVWLLHPWVRGGTLRIGHVAIAIAALLINLLAAGGIGFPGLGQNAWILAAIVLNLAESPPNEARVVFVRPKLMKVGGFAAALLLAGACYFTMYRPVLTARGYLADARLRIWDRQLRATELWAAAAADRWWARPCEDLAMLAVAGWIEEPSARGLDAFEAAMAESLDRDRDSNRLHWLHGDGLLRMFEQDRQPLLAHRAVAAYRRAVALYPNSNVLHAQLAWAWHLTGNHRLARQEAEEALRLDGLIPHEELKLANRRLVGPGLGDAAETAEQRMLFLRKANHGE